jgi:hypothetical protein
MIHFLDKIAEAGILLEVVEGKLKLLSSNAQIDPSLLGEIKERKEEILDYLIKNIGSVNESKLGEEEIPQATIAKNYAVSDSQRRLWIASQIIEASLAYHIPFQVELTKGLDLALFEKAIHQVIERHESLRTVFKQDLESLEVRQIILTNNVLSAGIERIIADSLDFENEVKAYVRKDNTVPFDLENGPLFRIKLFIALDGRTIFYVNMHHIISDGWSMEILTKDVFAFYDANKNDSVNTLSPLRIQYKDFAEWQYTLSENENGAKAFWLDKFSGEIPLITLPSSNARPPVKTYSGRHLRTYLSKETAQKISVFNKAAGSTSFVTFLATWYIMLQKYSGMNDLVLGTPVAGRDNTDLEDQIGFYVNMIALRKQLNNDSNFTSFHAEVMEDTLECLQHQSYPLT